ncbi:MAG: ABC transporter permease [Acidimicrobiia bacterium]
MWKVTLRGVWGKKIRFLLTGLAVILGVAFMVGTLVFTDTTRATFDDLFSNVNRGTDTVVRGKKAFDSNFGEQRAKVPEGVVRVVQGVEGVRAAEGGVQTYAQLVKKDGKALTTGGAPNLGFNYPRVAELNPFVLQPGSQAPETADEIVIDAGSARATGYGVGDSVTVLTLEKPKQYRITGVGKFGTVDSPGGATVVLFTQAEAQRVAGVPGQFDIVSVVGDSGVSQVVLAERIRRALTDPNVEVLTGAAYTKETQDQIAKSFQFFNTFLFVFAGVALFVGVFLIYNTFTIVVTQRLRELALLRALGAKQGQIVRSVLLESVVVGMLASIAGIVVGIGLSQVLKAGLSAAGIDLPSSGIVVLPNTVITGLVVGLAITVLSSIVPAVRAGRIPPMAALREGGVEASRRNGRFGVALGRLITGGVITAIGASALLVGLFATPENAIAYVGAGAIIIFVGVFVLAPTFARPLSRALGAAPVGALVAAVAVLLGAGGVGLLIGGGLNARRLGGQLVLVLVAAAMLGGVAVLMFRAGRSAFTMAGGLGRQNAMRSPRRTAATASALMIGVALVAFIAVFAQSIKASTGKIVDDAFRADLVVAAANFQAGLSPTLAEQIGAQPEVAVAAALRIGVARVDGSPGLIGAGDPVKIAEAFNLSSTGNFVGLTSQGLAVADSTMKTKGWNVGDMVPVLFARTGEREFRIEATYKAGAIGIAGPPVNYFMSNAAYAANFPPSGDLQIAIILAPGVSDQRAKEVIAPIVDQYPSAELQDQTGYKRAQEAQINQLVNLIFGLLALAILIAVLGIANTLGLSIYERRSEIGLLRAVGMTRAQLRDAIRWESVIVALFGTVLGFVVGVFFGWAVVQALKEDGISTLAIPYTTLGVVVILAVLSGILAAVIPARRAARMKVLDAIASK